MILLNHNVTPHKDRFGIAVYRMHIRQTNIIQSTLITILQDRTCRKGILRFFLQWSFHTIGCHKAAAAYQLEGGTL